MGNTLRTLSRRSEQRQETPPARLDPEDRAQNEPFTCEICIEPMLSPRKFKNRESCSHPFCSDCIVKYIAVKLECNAAKIQCPALDCAEFLDPIACRTLLGPQLFVKWCDVLCEAAVLEWDRCYCPNRNCSVLIVNECGGTVKRSKCPSCKVLLCFHCKLPWHAGFRCEESRELRDRNDVAFGVLAEQKRWARCPRCRHFVERIEGCKIINCRCGISFCYKCGKQVHQHWCGCDTASCCCIWTWKLLIFFLIVMFFYFIMWGFGRKHGYARLTP
ncbi:probable E3 ubiquitin-protein ligase RNF217 [Ipomoea triloba]|uniref:probable E3 ubiquitin-protein ligase RNF217 n=1 Tax=Ipomoea triloba TaxID=35885 RepID=UPI00125D1F79|nr:probable E3 ubiquitin-protein ligase RNF217 [Ipomoea triloba]